MNAKPFHIGTKVLPKNLAEDDIQDPDVVVAVFRTLMWVYQPYMDGVSVEAVDEFVHADDGAPLGEWVPLDPKINVNEWPIAKDDDIVLGGCFIEEVNAILRGEVER